MALTPLVCLYMSGRLRQVSLYTLFQKRTKILSLDIPILELSDTGQYMCIVRNDQGKIFTSCYLQVERELYIGDLLHECSYFVKFMKRVWVKRLNARLAEHYISFFATSLLNSIIQENEC